MRCQKHLSTLLSMVRSSDVKSLQAGKILGVDRGEGNSHEKYALAMKHSNEIVGHMPKEVSKTSLYLKLLNIVGSSDVKSQDQEDWLQRHRKGSEHHASIYI